MPGSKSDCHAANTTRIIGIWPHISPVTLSHSILVIKRYNLRLYVVFFVLVTWRQLPRCGPSSPKRLEQQGRHFCEPTCKKKWGKAKCISLPSIRHPPKPNLPYRCLSCYQPFNNNTTTVAYASTTAWVSRRKKTGLGLEGAIKLLRALPINVPISV